MQLVTCLAVDASGDPELGGKGVRTPPGKSQVIWVSIGNKQSDPPPLENVGPPFPKSAHMFWLRFKKKKKKKTHSNALPIWKPDLLKALSHYDI